MGATLSQAWGTKQLESTWPRNLMGRYEDFWLVTGSALGFAPDATIRPLADLREIKSA
jgi:2-haloacid dehalogenase